MGKLTNHIIISTFLCVILKYELSHGEIVKEVLIRDRLVMVLCDQRDEYLQTGVLPQPVKIMPEKYKNFRPTKTGRSAAIPAKKSPTTAGNSDAGGEGQTGRKVYKFVNNSHKTKDSKWAKAEKTKGKDAKEKNNGKETKRSRRTAKKLEDSCVLDLNDAFF